MARKSYCPFIDEGSAGHVQDVLTRICLFRYFLLLSASSPPLTLLRLSSSLDGSQAARENCLCPSMLRCKSVPGRAQSAECPGTLATRVMQRARRTRLCYITHCITRATLTRRGASLSRGAGCQG